MSDVKVNRTRLEKQIAKLIAFLNGFGLLLDSQQSGILQPYYSCSHEQMGVEIFNR